uniref:Peptidase S1 domain-containing protein n=1 Tax=Chelonoidis abingdonii TaxID=106734 RepID=A0A8C0JBK8_CHEAB
PTPEPKPKALGPACLPTPCLNLAEPESDLLSPFSAVCGQPRLNLNRLVKGQDTVPGEFPWQASIQWGGLLPPLAVDLPSPQTLQKLQVPIIDSKKCRILYLTNMQNRLPHRNIQDDMICAGYAEGMRDACHGDSGGPMACIVGDVWVLAGIVSWGEGCAIKNRPGVYSRLTSYQSWIREEELGCFSTLGAHLRATSRGSRAFYVV